MASSHPDLHGSFNGFGDRGPKPPPPAADPAVAHGLTTRAPDPVIVAPTGDSVPSASGSSGEVTFTHPDGDVTCPKFIGDYEILGLLGRGGMGNVFVARNLFFGRKEALKMLHDRFDSPEARELFVQEMQTQAGLDHRNIAKVHYAGRYKGRARGQDQLYFVMSLEAGDLGARVKANGPLPPTEAAQVVRRVAKAIAHAHAHPQKVIHCDLKPKNILLGADGIPKVTDFGLVRLLAHPQARRSGGRPFGTPAYMPPEQAEGKFDQVNEQSDVYGLGAVLYELLTGRPPYAGRPGQAQQVLDQVLDPHVTPRPPRSWNPAVPPRLEAICLKCLRKLPAERYASAAQVAAELDRFVRPPLWKRRWKEVTIAVLCAGLTWLAWDNLPSPRAAAAAADAEADQFRDGRQWASAIGRYRAAQRYYDDILDAGVVFDRERVKRKKEAVGQKLAGTEAEQVRQQQDEVIDRARAAAAAADAAHRRGARADAVVELKKAGVEYDRLDPARLTDPAIGPMAALGLARLAELYVEGRSWPEAQRALEQAERVLGGVTPAGHDDVVLARAEVEHIWGIFYAEQDKALQARAHFDRGLQLRGGLDGSRTDGEFRRDLARSHGYLGDVQLTTGQVSAARSSYLKAQAIRKQLAAEHPAVPAAQCLHARDFDNLARWFEWAGTPADLDKAAGLHRDRLTYLEKHVPPLPALLPGGHLTERANAALNLVELLLDRPEPPTPEVATLLAAARDEYEQLLDTDRTAAQFRAGAARMHLAWGRYWHRLADPVRARPELDRAADLLAGLEDDGVARADEIYTQAVTEALLGLLATATEFERLGHHLRALDLLRKAVRMKFRHAARLDRDHALKPLAAGHPEAFAAIRRDQRKLLDQFKEPAASGTGP